MTPEGDCAYLQPRKSPEGMEVVMSRLPSSQAEVKRLSFPLHGLMVSRYRGEGASPLPQRGGNFTRTVSQLSRIITSSSPIPGLWPFLGNGSHLPLVSRSLGLPLCLSQRVDGSLARRRAIHTDRHFFIILPRRIEAATASVRQSHAPAEETGC